MYLVEDSRNGVKNLVFTMEDPRRRGYDGQVVADASLDYDSEAVHGWPDGSDSPEVCVGQHPSDSKQYKVFRNSVERDSARYVPMAGTVAVFGSWRDYLKLRHAEDLSDEDWYYELDRYDEASRRRRQRQNSSSVAPAGKGRDEVAAWVASKHLIADSAIREVWYLPQNAPPEEIRLLELSERIAGDESKAEPIDFGLDIDGANFRLFVADVTSEQLTRIKSDPTRLPNGWTLNGRKIWRRGA